jgi:GWxTD domain-containing protein
VRFRSWFALALLALPNQVPALLAQQPADGLSLRAVRSYRAENGGQTRVRVLIQIPLSIMEPGPQGVSYLVAVKVADQAGITLHTDSWRTRIPGDPRGAKGAYGIEMLDFALAPGNYTVAVDVTDSVSAKTLSNTLPVEAYRGRPDASDLTLSSRMRIAGAGDTVPRPGEVRKGSTLYNPAAVLRLAPDSGQTEAYYVLESYNDGVEESGTMAVEVLDASGKAIFQTPATPIKVAATGGMLKGRIDLDGLPPGSYTLKVVLGLGGKTVDRDAPLTMADLEATLQKNVARIAQDRVSDEGYFKYMSPEQLDSAFAPLYYIATPAELKVWNKSLSDDAKKRYLTEFWQARDPTRGTPTNEARDQFYSAIALANIQYKERNVPGWKTDRGRIFAKNGAPPNVLRKAQVQRAPPYEVWNYPELGKWYIFADRTGVGNWRLLVSSDLKEPKQADWRDVLTEDGVRDSGRYLNVDFYGGQYQSY